MFIGHYAPAPLGAISGHIKLWQAFLAVQFVDFIWAIFILLGLEQGRIVPDFSQASPLDLHFMPYTHSLLGSCFWAIIGAAGFKILAKRRRDNSDLNRNKGAIIFGLFILSHWFFDVLVHVPDMTFWPGSVKIGFGLWQHVAISFPLEVGLTIAALIYYMRKTQPVNPKAKIWAVLFIGVLVYLQILTNFGPAPSSMHEQALNALIVFSLLVFLAARFERSRIVA